MTELAQFESSIDELVPGLSALAKNVTAATNAFRTFLSGLGVVAPAPFAGARSPASAGPGAPNDPSAAPGASNGAGSSNQGADDVGAAPPKRNAVADAALGAAGAPGRVIGAIASGDPTQMLVTAVGELVQRSKPIQYVIKLLNDLLTSLANSLTSFLDPLMPVIGLIVKVAGALGQFAGALTNFAGMEVLFDAVKFIGAVIVGAAAGLQWMAASIQYEVAQIVIRAAEFIGQGGAEWVAAFRETTKPVGELGEVVQQAYDSIDAIKYEDEKAAYETYKMGEAAEKATQALLNLPAGFKVANAVFVAAQASTEAFGGYTPPTAPASPPSLAAGGSGSSNRAASGGGDTFNSYGPIYVSGDESFRNVVTVSARQNDMTGRGTTGGRSLNRQTPTPHAPNSTQPYTPAKP